MRHLHFKLCLFCVWAFFASVQDANARRTLSGTVKDAGTGKALDGANVVVLRGEQIVSFDITDEKGEFSITPDVESDSLTLAVSMMGYASFREKIGSREVFHVALRPTAIRLQEVVIRAGRVRGRGDTLRYDASRFVRDNDKTVEDLMKRLPGISVDEHGNIRYRGKEIGAMYIEGLDMMGSRYKTVSKNLPAQSVKEVEVMDNHQRIKSLAGKIPSEVPDINIKLKDNFKDKWNVGARGSSGFSPSLFLYELEANALQIARKSQSLYALKLSDTGNGITKEAGEARQDMLPLPNYGLLTENTPSAPLKENRWLFDDAVAATANRLYRMGEDARVKVNTFYTRDDMVQESRSNSTFFNPGDTVAIDEQKKNRLATDKLSLSADYENNTPAHYLRNKLEADLRRSSSTTGLSGTYHIDQRQGDKSFSVKDNLSFTHKLENGNTVHAKSVAGYWQRNQRLAFDDYDRSFPLNGFYVRADASLIIGKTKIAQQYNAGFSADFNSITDNHRFWVTPSYEYLFRKFKFRASLPLQGIRFPGEHKSLFFPGATWRTEYKISYAWDARFSAQCEKETDDVPSFFAQPYYSDYRTVIENEKGVPVASKQVYSLRTEYKNTVREFFVTADLTAFRRRANYTFEQKIRDDNRFYLTRIYTPHNESSYGAETTVSKGFFDIGAKIALTASYRYNRSAQLRDGVPYPFSFRTLTLKPDFTIAPTSRTEIAYNGELQRQLSSFGHGNRLAALWSMSHKLSFSYTHKHLEASVQGEYFRNELTETDAADLLFIDLSAAYKLRRITFRVQASNLSDSRTYGYTIYNPLSVYSSTVRIRPREMLLGVAVAL